MSIKSKPIGFKSSIEAVCRDKNGNVKWRVKIEDGKVIEE